MTNNPFSAMSGFVAHKPPSPYVPGSMLPPTWEQEQMDREAAYKNLMLSGTANYANSAPNIQPTYLDPAFAPRPEFTPYPNGFPDEFYASQAAKHAAMTGTQVPQPPTPSMRTAEYRPAVQPSPTNPFAALMQQMGPQGFARPEAQAWMQQALSGVNMPGWGRPMAPGAPIGSAGGPGVPGAPGAPGGITNAPGVATPGRLLGSQLQISPEALKLSKKVKKAREASHFGWDDALKVAASAALGVATGGTTLAGQVAGGVLGGGGALLGSNKADKAIGGSLDKYRKTRDKALLASAGETGWTQKNGKGKWLDAEGNDLTMPQIMQQLINLGVLGG